MCISAACQQFCKNHRKSQLLELKKLPTFTLFYVTGGPWGAGPGNPHSAAGEPHRRQRRGGHHLPQRGQWVHQLFDILAGKFCAPAHGGLISSLASHWLIGDRWDLPSPSSKRSASISAVWYFGGKVLCSCTWLVNFFVCLSLDDWRAPRWPSPSSKRSVSTSAVCNFRKIAKNIYMYFNYFSIFKCKHGAAVESQTGSPEIAGLSPTCVV